DPRITSLLHEHPVEIGAATLIVSADFERKSNMRLDKMTSRLQNALSDAQSLAVGRDHSAVEALHLLSVLVESREASVLPMLMRAGAKPEALRARIQRALEDLPRLKTPTGEIGMGQSLARVLNMADRRAQKAGDTYISTEQVLLGMFADPATARPLQEAGVNESALEHVVEVTRSGETVTDPNAEAHRQALER